MPEAIAFIPEFFAALAPEAIGAGAGEAAAVGAGEGLASSLGGLGAEAAAAGAGAAPAAATGLEGLFSGIGSAIGDAGSALGFAPTGAEGLGPGFAGAGDLAAPISAAPTAAAPGAAGGAAAFAPPGAGAGAFDAATGPIGDFWASVNPETGGGLSGLTAEAPGPLSTPQVPALSSGINGATGEAALVPTNPAFNAPFGTSPPGVPISGAAQFPGGIGIPPDVQTVAAGASSPLDTANFPFGPNGAPGAPAAAQPPVQAAPGGAAAGGGAEIGPSASAAGPSSNASALSAGLDQQAIANTTIPPTDISAPAATSPAAGGSTTPASGGGIGDYLKKNPGLLAALGLGGASLAMGANKKLPQQANLQQLADQEKAFQQQQMGLQKSLTDPLLTGNLPPDQQASVDKGLQDAIATTKARYASMGLANSSALSDQIAYLTQQSQTIKGQLETQMAQTGTAAAGTAATAFGLQNSVFQSLMNAQIQQDTALRNAIAQFAGSAAIGSGLSARA